jgi:hypothetical protein
MSARTIVQQGNGRRSEAIATAVTILPGTLLERVAGAATVQAQSTAEAAGVLPEKMVAIEDSPQGKGVTDAYAASALIQIYHAQSGDILYMMLEDGENAAINDVLTPHGTGGTLKVRDTATNPGFAVCIEAKDLSASVNTADALVKICII